MSKRRYRKPELPRKMDFRMDEELYNRIVNTAITDPKEVIAELYGDADTEKAGDMATALQNPITKMQFYIADGEEDRKHSNTRFSIFLL